MDLIMTAFKEALDSVSDYTTSFDNGGDLSLKAHYTRFDQDREQTVFSQYFLITAIWFDLLITTIFPPFTL